MITQDKMTFRIPKINESDLDSLEQIYHRVRLHQFVQIGSKVYLRCRPVNTKLYQNKYHFSLYKNNIFSPPLLYRSRWGQLVNTMPNYRVKYVVDKETSK